MGVKSTVQLKRSEALNFYAELRGKAMRDAFKAEALVMSYAALEDSLERMNDAEHDGEGFENYRITENDL